MRTSVRDVFAAAAAAYDRGNPLLAVERPEMEALLPSLAGRDVLDVGAGRGHYAALARALGAASATALDLSPEMLEGAAPPKVVGDACRLPLRPAAVDVVIAALVLSYLRDPEAALAEAARVLRPGGTLLVSDLHPTAVERGWRRTFAGPAGTAVETRVWPHTIANLRDGLAVAGLALDTVREPRVGPSLEPHFQRAGRRDFEALRGTPLLVILRAHKGGR
jgi:malonyl-CoA O-methyltransferase